MTLSDLMERDPSHHDTVRNRLDTLSLPDGLLTPRELSRVVRFVAADDRLWRSLVRHDPEDRFYVRLHHTPCYEVWLLGWDRGQDTRIHDHGGCSGAACVTEGELFEQYGRAGTARPLRDRVHAAATAFSFGPDYVHNLGNLGPGPATSVHAYSPPLSVMRFYEPDRRGRLLPTAQRPVLGPEPDDRAAPEPVGGAA
jgi:hypothetical protein